MMRSSGRAAPQPLRYMYIDGAYLDEIAREVFMKVWGLADVPLDWTAIAASQTKVYYYHCPPPPAKEPETEEAWTLRTAPYFERAAALSELRGWHVFEGTVKRHKKRGPTQKEVDVQLAVDLLTHSFQGNMDEATLLAGDQDFRPVVEAASRQGMFVTVMSAARSSSPELRAAADARDDITPERLFSWVARGFAKPWETPAFGHAIGREAKQQHLADGTVSGSIRYLLLRRSGEYVVFSVEPNRNGNHGFWVHADKGLLLQYMDRLYGPIAWQDVQHGAGA